MSEPAEPELDGLTPEQLRYVRSLRKTASDRMVRVSTTGTFPWGWSFERWAMAATLAITFLGWFVFAGATWQEMKSRLDSQVRELSTVVIRVEAINSHLSAIQRQLDRQDTREVDREAAASGAPARPARVPSFPREEQFAPRPTP